MENSIYNYTHSIQVMVAAWPPFGGTQIDHLQLNSQVYLTPGFQVLGGYQKLGSLPDMRSSPRSRFAVLEHVKIMLWHLWLNLCEGKKLNAPPGLTTKYHTYGAMPPSTSMAVCIQVNIVLNILSSHSVDCLCWETVGWRRGMEKGINTTIA